MRITLFCVGSRGDVQPYVALGAGLQKSGHVVTVATHSNFEDLVNSEGLEFSLVEGNVQDILNSEKGHAWLEAGKSPIKFFTGIVRLCREFIDQLSRDSEKACKNAEAIIYSPLGLCAYSVAEQKKVPSCIAGLQPISPTGAFASPMFPQYPLGKLYNLFTHFASRQCVWQPFRKALNQWRHDSLQLGPYGFWGPLVQMHKTDYPALYAFSSSIVPKPSDWRKNCHVTGYWFLDKPDWIPSQKLLDFLHAGPPPVYIGFGSMSEREPKLLSELLIRALRLAGQRGILLSGWAELPEENLTDDVCVIDSVPHNWLFPKMAAVVHHGGAGTTGAAFRAGVPNIVVPFFGDQNFWAGHVFRLGTGPKPILRKNLTAENLSEAIKRAVSDGLIQKRARAIGETIRKEDGVAKAIEILETRILNRL